MKGRRAIRKYASVGEFTRLQRSHRCRYYGNGEGHTTGRNHLDPSVNCQVARHDLVTMIDKGQDSADNNCNNGGAFGDLLAKGHR